MSNSDWITINESGVLRIVPSEKNVGVHSFQLKASDGVETDSATFLVSVTEENYAPSVAPIPAIDVTDIKPV